MKRRGTDSTAALLQRASSQLKGERVKTQTEEDDLNAYISSLTKKTSGKKSMSFDEDSDISISNEDYQYGGSAVPITSSKYLKKKVQDSLDSLESIEPKDPAPSKFLKKASPPVAAGVNSVPLERPTTSKYAGKFVTTPGSGSGRSNQQGQRSSALSKAAALTSKITQRPQPARQSNVFTLETDSEDSFRKPAMITGQRSASPLRSASDSSMSLGRDGGKFVKKKSEPPPPPDFLKKEKAEKLPSTTGKFSPVHTQKSNRKLVGNVMLSSEEESLAEFIEGLSGSERSHSHQRSALSKSGNRASRVQRSMSPDSKPPIRNESPSPRRNISTPKPSVFRRSPSPLSQSRQLTRSLSEDSLPSEVSIEENFNVNLVMDIDTLGPVMSFDMDELSSPIKKADTSTPSPFYSNAGKTSPAAEKPAKKSTPKKSDIYSTKRSRQIVKSNEKENDLFSNFGLHTVDELMGVESKGSSKEHSVISDISEILNEKPGKVFKAKKAVNDSITEVYSDVDSENNVNGGQYSYSEKYDSISEKIGEVSSKNVSASEVVTKYSDEEDTKADTVNDYTEDFASDSESRAESYSDSYTSGSDSKTYSYTASSSLSEPRAVSKKGRKSVEVQTGDQPGLTYQWNTHHSGMAFMGPSFGMSFVDPTPIATHTVSPDAMEALTNYSPAMLALHDMLKQQLELTQTFIHAQQYLYNSYSKSIEPEHKYTTLEDTKKYIRKYRKPRLTFKEALKLVDREMS